MDAEIVQKRQVQIGQRQVVEFDVTASLQRPCAAAEQHHWNVARRMPNQRPDVRLVTVISIDWYQLGNGLF